MSAAQGKGSQPMRKSPPSILLASSIDVVLWAIAQQTAIDPAAIRARWPVDRATSYRWWHLLEGARVRAQNMPIPRQPHYRRPMAQAEAHAS
jgi:hypothetical protein